MTDNLIDFTFELTVFLYELTDVMVVGSYKFILTWGITSNTKVFARKIHGQNSKGNYNIKRQSTLYNN